MNSDVCIYSHNHHLDQDIKHAYYFSPSGNVYIFYKPYQIKKLILLIRKVQNNTAKLFQLVNFDS